MNLMLTSEARTFVRAAVPFALIGLLLHTALYIGSEILVYRYGQRNRFFMVKTTPFAEYDHVILGASHAAVFNYRDLNARLEEMTGSKILNLSVVGGGVTVNRLLFEYFLRTHRAKTALYFVDSFAFYSPAWNEDRLADVRLFQRAPFDLPLAGLLLRSPSKWSVTLDYIAGFSKINNPGRFEPDVPAEEGSRFGRVYRPVAQLDEERIAFLYPDPIGPEAIARRDRYLAELEEFVRFAESRGLKVVVVRPPIPARIQRLIPGEREFDVALKSHVDRAGAAFHDFSQVANDEKFFYDTDHLNLSGVLNFFENHLKHVITNPTR